MNTHIEALGWALLHSLWQGAALWLALEAVLAWPGLRSPRVRGRLAGGALALFFVVVAATYGWSVQVSAEGRAATKPARAETFAGGTAAVDAAHIQIVPVVAAAASGERVDGEMQGSVADGAMATGWRERVRPVLPWLVGGWAAGAVFGLARQAGAWRELRRLRRTPLTAPTAEWAERFAVLCARCAPGLRLPRFGEAALVRVPQVLGGWAPVILLPAGFLAGLPPAQAEAILTHELAHLVRRDFWLNVLQGLAEAVFFFHPAVRAINAHIRRERERACDDFAVERTGDALGYAKALAMLAGAWPTAAGRPALAADGHEPGDVLARVGRLLGRPAKPARRVRLAPGGLLAMVGAVAVYAALFVASPVIVAQVLTPAERVELVKTAVEETTPTQHVTRGVRPYPEGKIRIISEVRTADGSPVPEVVFGGFRTKNGDVGAGGSFGWDKGRTTETRRLGVVSLIAVHEDWAPAAVFDVAPAAGASEIVMPTLVLRKGNPLRVRLSGADGAPLAGVEIRVVIHPLKDRDLRHWNYKAQVTDAGGFITIPQADPAFGYVFEAKAEGRQNTRREVSGFKPGETVEWVSPASRAITGRVLTSGSGAPVVGATVHLTGASGTQGVHSQTLSEPPLTTTDGDGRFTLPGWDDAGAYVLRIGHADHESTVTRARSGEALMIELVPGGRRVSGRLRVLSEEARSFLTGSQRGLSVNRWVTVGEGAWVGTELAECVLTPLGKDEYRFEAGNLPEDAVHFSAVGVMTRANLKLRSDRHDLELVMDDHELRFAEGSPDASVAPEKSDAERAAEAGAKRVVELVVKTSDGGAFPDRRIHVVAVLPGGTVDGGGFQYHSVNFKAGAGTLAEVPVGAELRFYAPTDEPGSAGYWMPAARFTVPSGEGAARWELVAKPAGAATVEVTDANGAALPVERLYLEGHDEPPAAGPRWETLMRHISRPASRVIFPCVPLGGKYRVVVTREARVARSEWFTLDAARPMAAVAVRFAAGGPATARVRLPDGSPAADQMVSLDYRSDVGGHRAGMDSLRTDARGEVTFASVSPGPELRYGLSVAPSRDWQVASVAVVAARPEEWIVTLQPGLKATGRVLDGAGRPVADVDVTAMRDMGEDYEGPPMTQLGAETATDAEGRFRFSNLSAGRVKFFIHGKKIPFGTRFPVLELPAEAGREVRIVVE